MKRGREYRNSSMGSESEEHGGDGTSWRRQRFSASVNLIAAGVARDTLVGLRGSTSRWAKKRGARFDGAKKGENNVRERCACRHAARRGPCAEGHGDSLAAEQCASSTASPAMSQRRAHMPRRRDWADLGEACRNVKRRRT